jgi:predicted outer membrane repeat protein
LKREVAMLKKIGIILMVLMAFPVYGRDFYSSPAGTGNDCIEATPCELGTALDLAKNNGQGDTIFLNAGTYASSTPFRYWAPVTENYPLTIRAKSGLSSGQIIIDGENLRQVLSLNAAPETFINAHLTVTGITFRNGNTNNDGGGLFIETYGNILVKDCAFLNNTSTSNGGGLKASTLPGNIRIEGNRFEGNRGYGGGAFVATPVTATVVGNTFIDNISLGRGGGLSSQSANHTIEGNLFIGNQASSGKMGGGLHIQNFVDHSVHYITNNVFAFNVCDENGGGLNIGTNKEDFRAYLINNTIYENQGPGRGGGLWAYASSGEIHFYNNIIYGNTAATSGNDIYFRSLMGYGYNNNYDGLDGSWTASAGNFNTDPLFVDPVHHDFSLQSTSPMIDMGTTEVPDPPGLPSEDIDGASRIGGTAPDIGAYEYVDLKLVEPSEGEAFSACSYYDLPLFDWSAGDNFKSYEVHFSADALFAIPIVKVRGYRNSTEVQVKTSDWKKVLLLPGDEGGNVYWKVLGTRSNRTVESSSPKSIQIEPHHPVGTPTLSSTSKKSLPTVSWQNNCAKKFKVWFGSDSSFTHNKTFNYNVKNPFDNGGIFSKDLSSSQWSGIRRLVGDSTGSILYWKVESWDAANRLSETEDMHFELTE